MPGFTLGLSLAASQGVAGDPAPLVVLSVTLPDVAFAQDGDDITITTTAAAPYDTDPWVISEAVVRTRPVFVYVPPPTGAGTSGDPWTVQAPVVAKVAGVDTILTWDWVLNGSVAQSGGTFSDEGQSSVGLQFKVLANDTLYLSDVVSIRTEVSYAESGVRALTGTQSWAPPVLNQATALPGTYQNYVIFLSVLSDGVGTPARLRRSANVWGQVTGAYDSNANPITTSSTGVFGTGGALSPTPTGQQRMNIIIGYDLIAGQRRAIIAKQGIVSVTSADTSNGVGEAFPGDGMSIVMGTQSDLGLYRLALWTDVADFNAMTSTGSAQAIMDNFVQSDGTLRSPALSETLAGKAPAWDFRQGDNPAVTLADDFNAGRHHGSAADWTAPSSAIYESVV